MVIIILTTQWSGIQYPMIISITLLLLAMTQFKEEVLNQGDSIYFDGRVPHAMQAIGGQSCKFLSIVMHGKNDDAQLQDRFAYAPQPRPAKQQTDDRKLLYHEYMEEEWNDDGTLKNVKFNVPENFNFAYDVVQRLAEKCPEKIAMRWLSAKQELHDFTFKDIYELSG